MTRADTGWPLWGSKTRLSAGDLDFYAARPSADIIPPSLRDLFAWRFCGRTTNDVSSDIVLSHGWAARGYTANAVATNNPGAGLLLAEGGIPYMIKAAYLTDEDIIALANYAAWNRRRGSFATPATIPTPIGAPPSAGLTTAA